MSASAVARRPVQSVVSLLPNRSAAVLRCFKITPTDHALLLNCVAGLGSNQCSPEERRLLLKLEKRYMVRFCWSKREWTLAEHGSLILKCARLLLDVDIKAGPATILPFSR